MAPRGELQGGGKAAAGSGAFRRPSAPRYAALKSRPSNGNDGLSPSTQVPHAIFVKGDQSPSRPLENDQTNASDTLAYDTISAPATLPSPAPLLQQVQDHNSNSLFSPMVPLASLEVVPQSLKVTTKPSRPTPRPIFPSSSTPLNRPDIMLLWDEADRAALGVINEVESTGKLPSKARGALENTQGAYRKVRVHLDQQLEATQAQLGLMSMNNDLIDPTESASTFNAEIRQHRLHEERDNYIIQQCYKHTLTLLQSIEQHRKERLEWQATEKHYVLDFLLLRCSYYEALMSIHRRAYLDGEVQANEDAAAIADSKWAQSRKAMVVSAHKAIEIAEPLGWQTYVDLAGFYIGIHHISEGRLDDAERCIKEAAKHEIAQPGMWHTAIEAAEILEDSVRGFAIRRHFTSEDKPQP